MPAVEALRTAQRIETYGIGSAAPISEDLAYQLMQFGYAGKVVMGPLRKIKAPHRLMGQFA